MTTKHLSIIFIVLGLSLFCSCSAIKEGVAILRAPRNFIDIGNRVHIESRNDEQFGQNLKDVLPFLVDSVEKKELHKFIDSPDIYVCNTNKSFCKYAGSKYPGPRAKVTLRGLFISPRLKEANDWYKIIYHELSHVILIQYLGIYHYIQLPIWFDEGLATYISNGGGSGNITDSAATSEILQGNHFHPVESENRLFPKSFSNDNIPPWMEYRQSMLFVKFLKEGREKEFEGFLDAVFNKESFSKTIEASYQMNVSELWNKFLEKSKTDKNHNSASEEKNAPSTGSQRPK
jgi:hypothetical protein